MHHMHGAARFRAALFRLAGIFSAIAAEATKDEAGTVTVQFTPTKISKPDGRINRKRRIDRCTIGVVHLFSHLTESCILPRERGFQRSEATLREDYRPLLFSLDVLQCRPSKHLVQRLPTVYRRIAGYRRCCRIHHYRRENARFANLHDFCRPILFGTRLP